MSTSPARYTLRVVEKSTGREIQSVSGVREDKLDAQRAALRRGWPERTHKIEVERQRSRTPEFRREPIPERVRHEVWRRDQGRCVDCGSRDRLEFDHIVPVSRGGANTTRNLELRCENCNRRKGARI